MHDALGSLPRFARLVLIDLVRAESHEARLAFPTLQQDVVERCEGRLAWAGSIDQQLVGRGFEAYHEVVISELPSADACARALALRKEWQPELIVSGLSTLVAMPWSRFEQAASRAASAVFGLVGRGPTPLVEGGRPEQFVCEGARHLDPDRAQLERLLASEREGPVVMLDFLRFTTPSSKQPWDAPSGETLYAPYARTTARLAAQMGGRVRLRASRLRVVDGLPESPWQEVSVIEYPSRAAYLGMLMDDRHRYVVLNRQTGLDITRTLVCTPHARF